MMAMASVDIIVVGAGVVGLTAAVLLAESGFVVEVRSAATPDRTTSAAAGAMWSLSFIEPSRRVVRWSKVTLTVLTELAAVTGSGIRLVSGVEAARQEWDLPEWAASATEVQRCEPTELPPGFVCGRRFTVPIIDMPVYLGYLRERLVNAGGRLRMQPVISLRDLLAEAEVVVNCAGVRAGELAQDDAVYPVRGQVVVVSNPGLTEFFAAETGDDPELLYVLPQGDRVVLGGSAEPHNWSLKPDEGIARAIVARCSTVLPSLASAAIIEHRVGLRPARRNQARLSVHRQSGGGRLIHSYGHGGAGVSVSWGAARELLVLLGSDVALDSEANPRSELGVGTACE